MSAKSLWFGLDASFEREDEDALFETVAGWTDGLRRIPHA